MGKYRFGIGQHFKTPGTIKKNVGKELLWCSVSTYEKEMLVIVLAVQKWRRYILGSHFKVKMDHQSLKYLMQQWINTPTQQRWITKLMGYDFNIFYNKGSENTVADALSCEFKITAISMVNI